MYTVIDKADRSRFDISAIFLQLEEVDTLAHFSDEESYETASEGEETAATESKQSYYDKGNNE